MAGGGPKGPQKTAPYSYRFQVEFCNPASGNEKGNVENKVGYSRRNAFVPVPVIASFEEFNKQLLEWCEKDADRLHSALPSRSIQLVLAIFRLKIDFRFLEARLLRCSHLNHERRYHCQYLRRRLYRPLHPQRYMAPSPAPRQTPVCPR